MTPPFTRKQWVSSHIILALFLLMAIVPVFLISNRSLVLSFLDVGQGDSILIQAPNGKNVLIDAGPGNVVVDRLGEELGFFNKKIDIFIMTHPDRDHYAGVMDVLQKYKIGSVMLTGIAGSDSLYEAFFEELKRLKIPIIYPSNKADLQIGPTTYLDVLYPFEGQNLIGRNVKDKNSTSVVVRLIHKGESVAMLSGDAPINQERELALSGQRLSAEILKLGHHGSKTSSSDLFLNAVNAKTVVVSAGVENKYGHPHKEVLDRVSSSDIRGTINEGTVRFVVK